MYLWTRKLPLNFGSHADLVPDRRIIFEVILPLWQKGENLATFIDNSRRCLRIHTKFSFLKIINFVRICLTGNKRFDFGADSNHNPDTRIFSELLPLLYYNTWRMNCPAWSRSALRVLLLISCSYYILQGCLVFTLVCLSVCQQDNSKIRRWMLITFLEEWDVRLSVSWLGLAFDGHLVQDESRCGSGNLKNK